MNKKVGLLFLLVLLWFRPTPIFAQTVNLEFIPSTQLLSVGEKANLTLRLNPETSSVIGVDVYAHFDPTYIVVNEVKSLGVFSQQIGTDINNAKGTIKFSLINPYGIYERGIADIAKISIEAKAPVNKTGLFFDFIKGQTQDSNVVDQTGGDILNSTSPAYILLDQKATQNSDNTSQSDLTGSESSPLPSTKNVSATTSAQTQASPSELVAELKSEAGHGDQVTVSQDVSNQPPQKLLFNSIYLRLIIGAATAIILLMVIHSFKNLISESNARKFTNRSA